MNELEKRKQERDAANKKAEAREKSMMRSLMSSDDGVWILRQVMRAADIFSDAFDKSSYDAYRQGKRSIGLKIAHLVQKHGTPDQICEIIHKNDDHDGEKP